MISIPCSWASCRVLVSLSSSAQIRFRIWLSTYACSSSINGMMEFTGWFVGTDFRVLVDLVSSIVGLWLHFILGRTFVSDGSRFRFALAPPAGVGAGYRGVLCLVLASSLSPKLNKELSLVEAVDRVSPSLSLASSVLESVSVSSTSTVSLNRDAPWSWSGVRVSATCRRGPTGSLPFAGAGGWRHSSPTAGVSSTADG